MARRDFILRCKRTLNDCTRQLTEDTGPNVFQSTLVRMETMQRSLQLARGRLINIPAADELLRDIAEYIAEVNAHRQPERQTSSSYQAPLICSGGRGAPYNSITREQLSFLKSCGFSLTSIAEILQVSLATVKRHMKKFNLNHAVSFSEVSDDALDEMIKDIVAGNDQLGSEAVRAQLQAGGVQVQRHSIRKSLARINPRAAALREKSQRPQRRLYREAGPNSLWHLDGNHKLIRWRIVIHGGIDGYSRLIVFLRASDNNRSSTVLDCFLNAVAMHGVPSRVRTDHGGENNAVCVMMNIFRGLKRGSAIRGRSTHNQRIERLWGDMWRGFNNVYYNLFNFLESEDIVDIDNEMHLWALHYVFLPRINRDLTAFTRQWNNHGLRTERHQTPFQIFVRGCLEQQGQSSTAMQDIFGTTSRPADENDTTSEQGQTTSGRQGAAMVDWPERVAVPQNRYTLDNATFEQLAAQFDPLGGARGELGLDIFCNVLSFLASNNQ
ncbi:uncharacterized protein LOC130571067 [Triplophysa rosa]|uniref:uncharacterized protein LOC130571067 n=1 Tax=Triplophysa rosa TaxID=992332 RepID=UPI002545E738|nr:uncharacterized protein LOC130571067 [Triplophysa rosa]